MHEVLVNRLGGLSLPRKSVVRLTDRPDMTLDVYRGRKTTMQHESNWSVLYVWEEIPVEHNATIIIKVAIVPSEVSHRLKYCLKEQLNPKEPTNHPVFKM